MTANHGKRRRLTGTQIEEGLTDAARKIGYLVFHDNDSRGNERGFPDLLIAGYGAIFAFECKSVGESLRPPSETRKGRAIPGQADWLLELQEGHARSAIVQQSAGEFTHPIGCDWLTYEQALDLLNITRTDYMLEIDDRTRMMRGAPTAAEAADQAASAIAGEPSPYR